MSEPGACMGLGGEWGVGAWARHASTCARTGAWAVVGRLDGGDGKAPSLTRTPSPGAAAPAPHPPHANPPARPPAPQAPGISAQPCEDNLRHFSVAILGPEQSAYEGERGREWMSG